MEGREILQNLYGALRRVMRVRMLVSSPAGKVADVPAVYAALLLLAAPWPCVLAFVVGAARRYTLRFEKQLERRP